MSDNSISMYKFKPFEFTVLEKSQDPNKNPLPRSGHRIVCNNSYLFSYGGFNPQTVFVRLSFDLILISKGSNCSFKYNLFAVDNFCLSSNTLSLYSLFFNDTVCFIIDVYIKDVNGRRVPSSMRELWKYCFDLKEWKMISCQNVPQELASSSVSLSGNIIFIYGGTGIPFGSFCSNRMYLGKILEF